MKLALRKKIREGLVEQLHLAGADVPLSVDLVDDYMALWDTKNALIQDIQTRGATVAYTSDKGTVNHKKNESISELVKVNGQMVKLLDALGINPGCLVTDDEM